MTGQRGYRGRFLAWALLAMLAAYGLFWGGGWVATYYVEVRIWALIPAFIAVAVWVIVAIRDPFWRPRTTLAPAFSVAFAAFVICTVTSSSPRFGVEYLALAILLVALYLILQRLMASDFFRPRMVGFATITGILIGTTYMAVTVPHWITWWGLIGHVAPPTLRPFFESLTYGNPSAVMTASVLLAAPAVAHLAGGSMSSKVTAIAVIVLAGVVTIVSGSRAGWLAIGVAIVAVGAFWLAAPDRRALVMATARSRTTQLLAVPAVLVAGAVALIAVPGFLFRATSGGEGLRTTYWAAAIRMFESSPIVGTGPGTWVPQRVNFTLAGESDFYIPHAHDIYLQTLAEFGIVGLLAGLVVVVALGRLMFGAIRDTDPGRRRMGWAALFATAYFAAHQLLDFYANAPAILFAYAITIAWLDATAPAGARLSLPNLRWTRARPRWLTAAGGVGGIAVLVASAAYLGWSEGGASLMAEGTDLLNDRKPAEALAPLTEAVRMDPAMPPYHFALGLALADTGDLTGAEEQFALVASMDGLPTAWLDLAAARAKLGDFAGADEALGKAMRLGVQQAGVAIGAGVVQLQLDDTDAAVTSFVKTLLLNPTLAGDTWWISEPARAAIWPNVYRTAFDQAPATSQFVMALAAGDALSAAAAITRMDDAETATTSTIVLKAWGGDDDAMARLQARAHERVLDLGVISWNALLARRSGDTHQAASYSTWAETLNGDSSLGGYETRIEANQKRDRPAGINSLFYGQYTYRRAVPNHQLVDWLPELAYE